MLRLNQTLGLALLGVYFGFLLYRIFRLIQAWQTTRTIRRVAVELEPHARVAEIIRRCELEIGTRSRRVKVFRSEKLLLIVISLLLLVPCVAAATYAMRFDFAQDPATQEKERNEKEKLEMRRREDREVNATDGSIIKTQKELPRKRHP